MSEREVTTVVLTCGRRSKAPVISGLHAIWTLQKRGWRERLYGIFKGVKHWTFTGVLLNRQVSNTDKYPVGHEPLAIGTIENTLGDGGFGVRGRLA